MSYINHIRLLASLEVPPGTSKRFVCPACRGGTSHEESLVITHHADGGAVYKCHRASCGVKGSALRGKGVILKHPKFPRRYEGYLRTLTDKEYQFFMETFGLLPGDLREVRYSDELDRFMFPVRGLRLQHRGWIARTFNPKVSPKALIYKEVLEEPFIGFVAPRPPHPQKTVVVVEDYLSSCKVAAAGYHGAVLSGVHCPPDAAQELAVFKHVIVALDKDAFSMGIKMARRYEGVWNDVKVWYLNEDLRYVDITLIRDHIESGETNFSSVSEGPGGLRGDLF